MTQNAGLKSPLACPHCRKPIELDSRTNPHFISCQSCKLQFFVTNDVAWLFRSPQITMAQWQGRWAQFQAQVQNRLAKIDHYLSALDLMEPTRRRLTQLQTALAHNLGEIEKILNPMLTVNASHDAGHSHEKSPIQIMAEKIPSTQHFDNYFNNIFRDWAIDRAGATDQTTGEAFDENKRSVDLVTSDLGADNSRSAGRERKSPRELVVLGSGAGRLAYDLHLRLQPQATYSLDINPLLMLLQKMMVNGQTCELYEIPRPAQSAAHVAIRRKLAAHDPRQVAHDVSKAMPSALADASTFHCLLGDAMSAPFRDHSIDMLITPWLIDILPERFDLFARRMNRLLAIGGEWRIFGPLSYSASPFHNDRTSYNEDEISELLAHSGFEVTKKRAQSIPYLSALHAGQKREEQVWLFVARKERHEKEPPTHSFLPEWILHTDRPIPSQTFFVDYRAATRLQTEALSLVNGQNSLADMTRAIAQHYGAAEDATLNSLIHLFSSLIETHYGHFQ